MKKIMSLAVVTALGLGFSGCVKLEVEPNKRVQYNHKVKIVDINKQPVDNVELKYVLHDKISGEKYDKSLLVSDSHSVNSKLSSYNRKTNYREGT